MRYQPKLFWKSSAFVRLFYDETARIQTETDCKGTQHLCCRGPEFTKCWQPEGCVPQKKEKVVRLTLFFLSDKCFVLTTRDNIARARYFSTAELKIADGVFAYPSWSSSFSLLFPPLDKLKLELQHSSLATLSLLG